MSKRTFALFFLILWLGLAGHAFASPAAKKHTGTADTSRGTGKVDLVELPKHYTSQQVDSILASLSDEQVRRLLIAELQKAASDSRDASQDVTDRGILSGFLERTESGSGLAQRRLIAMASNIKNIPYDIQRALDRLTEGKGISHLLWMITIIFAIFVVGIGGEQLYRHLTAGMRKRIESVPHMEGLLKFWSVVLKMLSDLLGIIAFTLSTLVLFLLISPLSSGMGRLLFVACLAAIVISRVLSSFSRMVCSPAVSRLRLIPLSDQASEYLHRNLVRLIRVTALGLMTYLFLKDLGMQRDSYVAIAISFGTVMILMIGHLIWKNRADVSRAILNTASTDSEGRSWLKEQFAAIWHVLAAAYLFFIWLFWAGRLVIFETTSRGAFFISLLIVPIYLALDRAGLWITMATIGAVRSPLNRPSKEGTDSPGETETKHEVAQPKDKTAAEEDNHERRYALLARRVVRTIIFFVLVLWLLYLWGFGVPFGKFLANAAFSIFVTLILANILWRTSSSFINRKLQEASPAGEEARSGEGDEWGAVALGRSHTLLPVLQKFIGVVLVIMVSMIILSSIGVNIGPLLAGAGVVGLAIGFGAQKLVSDILSGTFFLVDDAFRVGEYIQAGNVSGTVEGITMRNVKLRHHRGMLQIVPYSDLGPVTNFMRGGIVVKFNLALPYDTDIDTVRKIIKKVGEGMMEDEEFGADMIEPLKSQGVRDVGDSVFTFRVKFTARPGTQFTIRREAFKRITEALAKKGIHYAHRKVIVDIPPPVTSSEKGEGQPAKGTGDKPVSVDTDQNKALIAGAAAALETMANEKKEEKG